ncbi:MAG: hypothetical protein WBM43_01905 [Flavobacteriaceae bacterium]
MPHILRSRELEVHFDQPNEGYNFSRFDWTGKITLVKFQDEPFSTLERMDSVNINEYGQGLYNEFGMDTALGFKEAEMGDWFHKIGVGALRKQTADYQFTFPYEIRPANFIVEANTDRITVNCLSEIINGYVYELKKEFQIHDNCLTIDYILKNTGSKPIVTEEYVHNFLGIAREKIDAEYVLKFPFEIDKDKLGDKVNPGKKVILDKKEIRFSGASEEQFFFSYLNGDRSVQAIWELEHSKRNVGVRESVSFISNKINLWGWEHVISPEIFHQFSIEPGESTNWTRTYDFYHLN